MVVRRGFGLVEVIVAMTLLAIGVMSVAATSTFALQLVRRAELEEAAARLAATVIDSLSFGGEPGAGSRADGRLRTSWEAAGPGDRIQVTVAVPDVSGIAFVYETFIPPAVPSLPAACIGDGCAD